MATMIARSPPLLLFHCATSGLGFPAPHYVSLLSPYSLLHNAQHTTYITNTTIPSFLTLAALLVPDKRELWHGLRSVVLVDVLDELEEDGDWCAAAYGVLRSAPAFGREALFKAGSSTGATRKMRLPQGRVNTTHLDASGGRLVRSDNPPGTAGSLRLDLHPPW
jgi:hypothetical protein